MQFLPYLMNLMDETVFSPLESVALVVHAIASYILMNLMDERLFSPLESVVLVIQAIP